VQVCIYTLSEGAVALGPQPIPPTNRKKSNLCFMFQMITMCARALHSTGLTLL